MTQTVTITYTPSKYLGEDLADVLMNGFLSRVTGTAYQIVCDELGVTDEYLVSICDDADHPLFTFVTERISKYQMEELGLIVDDMKRHLSMK